MPSWPSWRDTVSIVDAVRVIEHPVETLEARARTLALLAEIFAEVGSDHALIGGIAVGFHARKRATEDVDILVPRVKLDALEGVLVARGYLVTHSRDMLRVYPAGADPEHDEAIADLVAWEANSVLEEAARVAGPAIVLGHHVKIVPRGALVALKFHAAVSPRRAVEDRYQDVADIGRILKKHWTPEDQAVALRIAAHGYPDADAELARLIDDLVHDRAVKI